MTKNLGEKLTDKAEMRAREILKAQDIAKIEAGHLPDCEEYMVCQTCECAEIKLQARLAELEDLLGRYANEVADQNGIYFEPAGPEGVYIIKLAERYTEANKAKEKP